MRVVLFMVRPDGERRSFPLTRDMTVVGRREDCDLRIPLSDVSRKHCRFITEGETIRVEDLGSSNGTFHNGQKVQEGTLAAGDTVQVGPVTFTVQIDGVPVEEDIQPQSEGIGAPSTVAPSEFSTDPGEGDAVAAPADSSAEAFSEFLAENKSPEPAEQPEEEILSLADEDIIPLEDEPTPPPAPSKKRK